MGGIGSYVRQCAAALAAAGHDVHVFTLTVPAELRSQTPAGVWLHETPDLASRVAAGTLPSELAASINAGGEGIYRLAIGVLLTEALLAAHRERPFDVVETPDVEALGLPLLMREGRNVPVITHLHCCTAIAYHVNQVPLVAEHQLIAGLEFAGMKLADARCAPTWAVVEATMERLGGSLDVDVIPHPVAESQTAFVEPPVNGPAVFIGRIERLKGVGPLGEALNIILAKHASACFNFIGPDTSTAPGGGSMRQEVQSRLRPEIAPRVRFLGELPRSAVAEALQTASFAVLPSFSENFSMACCEAFVAGRTAIVGAGTGSVELVGEAGLVVDPRSPEAIAAAMDVLWSDRSRLLELSRRAYGRVRTVFCPATIIPRRIAAYEAAQASFRRQTPLASRFAQLPAFVAGPLLSAVVALTTSLAGAGAPTLTPGRRLLAILERVAAGQEGRPAQVLLYGAGKHTARLLAERRVWEVRGHRVTGLIDDHPRFAAEACYLDLPVCSVRELERRLIDGGAKTPVVLSTDTYQDQFWKQTEPLRRQGVAVFRLYE